MKKHVRGTKTGQEKYTLSQVIAEDVLVLHCPTHAVLIRTEAIGKTGTGGQGDGERQDRTSGE